MAKKKKGKGKGKGKSKGLHGPEETPAKSKASGFASVGKELSKPLFIVGGLLLGNLVGKGIDKVITVDDSATGFQVKKLVKPLLQAGLGVGVILVARDKANEKNGIKMLKGVARNLGYGIAGSGVISGAKLMKADLFEGLGETGNPEKKPVEAKYFREAHNEILKMLKDNSFKPMLPAPAEGEHEEDKTAGEETEMSGTDIAEDAEIL